MTRESARHALRTGRCLRCNSQLLRNYDDLDCLNCGTMYDAYPFKPWDLVAERRRQSKDPA